MASSWRLIDSGLVDPPRSAALDEAILEAHSMGRVPETLHLYVRNAPTISIGYFQRVAQSVDLDECRRRGVSIVRRKSGGSSIFTDQGQLIYGLVMRQDELPDEISESFELVCSSIAKAVSSLGVVARYRPPNDVEVGGRKISGNAQLRRRGSVLQHGTIIVESDLAAMDATLKVDQSKAGVTKPSERVTTLSSALGHAPKMSTVKDALVRTFSETFGVGFSKGRLSDHEVKLVDRLVGERYSRDDWNLKR